MNQVVVLKLNCLSHYGQLLLLLKSDCETLKTSLRAPAIKTDSRMYGHNSHNNSPNLFHMEERFQACLLLSAVGDSLGYRNGLSGFCRSGPALHADIHKESPSGVNGITVAPPSWKLSDATVMSLGTAEAITGDLRGEELTAVTHQHRHSCVKPP